MQDNTDFPLIAPSVLAADFTRLAEEIAMVNSSRADWLHVDVMDGRFVPNISFGMFIVEAIGKLASKPLDVHLMIVEPERYVPGFAEAGAHMISVHIEACPHLHRNIEQIRNLGVRAGVAINPHTPVQALEEILPYIDMVCVMSVNPGFGGQRFIETTYRKVRQLRDLAFSVGREDLLIEVDGGVVKDNAADLVHHGANVLVAGSAVFRAQDPVAMIDALKKSGTDKMIA